MADRIYFPAALVMKCSLTWAAVPIAAPPGVLIAVLIAVVLALLPATGLSNEAPEVPCQPQFVPASGSYDFAANTNTKYELPPDIRIGDIHITNLDIFDEANPDENNRLYRIANRFHLETKPKQIMSVLTVAEGDLYNSRATEESARLLRNQKYLYDANVRPVSLCDNVVDVEVITRDVWSLSLNISFDRSGGENNFGLGVRDTNLLGTGTELSVRTKQDIDRDTNEIGYKNRNVRGSRLVTRLRYSDSDDGFEYVANISLPFYSLDARRSWIVSYKQFERVDAQYLRGDDVSEVLHVQDDHRIGYGFSRGLIDGVARRWVFGYRYLDQEFSESDELPPPEEFPVDKTLSYPFIEYSSVQDKYVRRVNMDQINRTEDLHVGRHFFSRFGYSAEAYGGDQDRFVMEGEYSNTLHYNDRHLLMHEVSFFGLLNTETDRSEDVQIDYHLRYLHSRTRKTSYLANLTATYSHNLNTHRQITLGGDTGVRAFDNRFQVGDRKFVLNLERRTFTDLHIFNLIRVGWAFFADIGRAWDPDLDTDFEDEYLANVGLGLRLASSKSNLGRVMHIDFAVPLTNRDDEDVDSSLVSVRLTNSF
jgi:hypothetical protein